MPTFINPSDWIAPKGYNNGCLLSGTRTLCIAGQVAWDAKQQIVGRNDFPAQFKQALKNVRAVVEAAGGSVEHIGRLTIFVTDVGAYRRSLREIGAAYREVFGKHFPAMALIGIAELLEDGAMVEIEATAVLP